ncbi:uncharacterized protein BDR25DRAFT_354869 [Lindgomyces ingoldianus]|uniref:Uncharacterized protein n=1 Tax=Lindgomyces ingoldianus TaxID=673940 RepID=A0ACB6QXX1_9PLEO|nr:uncharacterized protein BDR25DRAFT_354869 [Lindgomyces ingoldianus]KAF2470932.1 hypothetical protein BDR25DRAFT_354869 [Lindgomyces ingoldianus]
MNNATPRKLRGSLGDSWGDAEYESDGGASIHSASDFGSETDSECENAEHEEAVCEDKDVATPLPSRVTRASSRTPQGTPAKTPVNRAISRHSQSTRSNLKSQARTTPASESLEPSFIMPSMSEYGDNRFNGSPLRQSQMRVRHPSRRFSGNQNGSVNSTPNRGSRNPSAQVPHSPPPQNHNYQDPWLYLSFIRDHVVLPVLQYIVSVFAMAFEMGKPLVAMGFVVLCLFIILSQTSGIVSATVHATLSSLCKIPGSSFVLPFCASPKHMDRNPAFDDLMNIQSTFEDVLEASINSFSLPQAMKRSEASIRDLKTQVKHSKLPSRAELEVEFQFFVDTAREASRDLTKYNSKIGYTMDKVISTNRWTMTILSGLMEKEASSGSFSRLLTNINPLGVFMAPPATIEQLVFDQYVNHVSTIKDDIGTLILTAEGLLYLLQNLEDRLDLIADLAVRDGMEISKDKEQLLSQLWSKLGGNAPQKRYFNEQLAVLREVTKYRKVAWMHVSATLLKLQEIQAGLENLREGVAAPELVGMTKETPMSYYLEVIGNSLNRLRDVRVTKLCLRLGAKMGICQLSTLSQPGVSSLGLVPGSFDFGKGLDMLGVIFLGYFGGFPGEGLDYVTITTQETIFRLRKRQGVFGLSSVMPTMLDGMVLLNKAFPPLQLDLGSKMSGCKATSSFLVRQCTRLPMVPKKVADRLSRINVNCLVPIQVFAESHGKASLNLLRNSGIGLKFISPPRRVFFLRDRLQRSGRAKCWKSRERGFSSNNAFYTCKAQIADPVYASTMFPTSYTGLASGLPHCSQVVVACKNLGLVVAEFVTYFGGLEEVAKATSKQSDFVDCSYNFYPALSTRIYNISEFEPFKKRANFVGSCCIEIVRVFLPHEQIRIRLLGIQMHVVADLLMAGPILHRMLVESLVHGWVDKKIQDLAGESTSHDVGLHFDMISSEPPQAPKTRPYTFAQSTSLILVERSKHPLILVDRDGLRALQLVW